MPLLRRHYYSRADIRANRDWLFAFGDNLMRFGLGGQAGEARGEPNAVGIVTKRAPRRHATAYLFNADLPLVVPLWQSAFGRINQHLLGGGTVVWPAGGVGTGRAELKQRAPAAWAELQLFVAGMEATAAAAADLRRENERANLG